MSREQRREEGIQALFDTITAWADADPHGAYANDAARRRLAERIFEQQPAYCPYDSSCHDDECPCSNCEPTYRCSNRTGSGCQAPAYPCGDDCPDQGD